MIAPESEQLKENHVIIFGASGHAKVVIDILEKQNIYKLVGLVDDNTVLKGQKIYGYNILGGIGDIGSLDCNQYLVAIGDNQMRFDIALWLEMNNFILAEAIVHPSAQLARGVFIAAGSVVMAASVVNSDTTIGKNTIVNTGATIDHDCVIGDAVHIAPGSTICGGVSVGDLTLIGAGSVIHPNIKIGKNVIVGAGATVLKDIPDGVSVIGTPAKEIV